MRRHLQFTRPGSVWLGAVLLAALAWTGSFAQAPENTPTASTRVQARSYVFAETGEPMPFALFVPSNYDSSRAWPLIVGLHGAGRSPESFMAFEGLVDLAQRFGCIVVTPLGYHDRGGFGGLARLAALGQASAAVSQEQQVGEAVVRKLIEARQGLPANIDALSEQDVLNVLAIVRKEYHVDSGRIFLWGHSMGGGGALYLAAKYPNLWAAVAVAAPAPSPTESELEQMQRLPVLVLQGDADKTVHPEGTRRLVASMAGLGMQHLYIEIKDGGHTDFVEKNPATLAKVLSFFDVVQVAPREEGH